MIARVSLALALALALAACQPGTTPSPGPSPSPSASVAPSASPGASATPETADTEGCEHLESGPATAVTASHLLASAGPPPKVDNDHRRYDITLQAARPGDLGTTVEFESDEAGDYVLFLNKDIPVKVKNVATGAEVALEESTASSTVCTAVKGRHVVELGVGVYALEFGPTAETQVSLVIEETGHGDHEEQR